MNNHTYNKNGKANFIGIIVALPRELKTLGYHRKAEKGIIRHSKSVSIFLSGMGKENAANAAEQLIQNGANHLISWGTAAALTPEIAPGSLLIPKNIITPERKKISTQPLEKELLRQLAGVETIYIDSLCTAGQVLSDVQQKKSLMEQTKAASTDMESGAAAKVAQKHDIPFTAIRAVSDSSEMIIPESILQNTNSDGFADISSIVKQAMISPKDWLPMSKLYYNFGKAQKTLQKAAKIMLSYLSETGRLTTNFETKG